MPRSEPPVSVNHDALRALRSRTENPATPGKKWTVTAFAVACGIKQSHQSLLESGNRKASAAVVKRAALTLGVPVAALLANTADADDPRLTEGAA